MTSIPASARVIRVTVACALLCFLNACGNSSRSVPSGPVVLIEPHVRVGKIAAGMVAEEVMRVLGQPSDTARFGGRVRSLAYQNQGFTITFDSQGVVKVVQGGGATTNDSRIEAFKGRTKEGLGMGSSRAAVIKALGPPSEIKVAGGFEALHYRNQGLVFGLTADKVHLLEVALQAAR